MRQSAGEGFSRHGRGQKGARGYGMEQKKIWGFGFWFASEPVLGCHEAAVEQLESMGARTSDLDAIIRIHLDCDHANGLCAVNEA